MYLPQFAQAGFVTLAGPGFLQIFLINTRSWPDRVGGVNWFFDRLESILTKWPKNQRFFQSKFAGRVRTKASTDEPSLRE